MSREGKREGESASKVEVTVLCNLITKVTSPCYCVDQKQITGPTHIQERELHKGANTKRWESWGG